METKLCKDCKHVIQHNHDLTFSKCSSTSKGKDVVTGRDLGFFYCETTRSTLGECGPDAVLFEPTQEKVEAI